jgi:hypothetical protein
MLQSTEVCLECDEPFLAGDATDTITNLLSDLQSLNAEVSVFSYPESVAEAAGATAQQVLGS